MIQALEDRPSADLTPPRVVRSPILDRRGGIHAVELLSNEPAGLRRDAVLLGQARTLPRGPSLDGQRRHWVGCTLDSLLGILPVGLDPRGLVLEPALPAGIDQMAIATSAARFAQLRKVGLRLAFAQEVLGSAWRPWLAQADYIRLDLQRLPGAAVPALVRAARQGNVQVLGAGVDDPQQHDQLASLGVDLFQGQWQTRPRLRPDGRLAPGQATVLGLIALLQREADVTEIEEHLKHDPALSFQILRYLNSGAFGLTAEVVSFRGAIMMLGQKRLLRWATMLLAGSGGSVTALGHSAVVRGRLMELLAIELMPPDACDQAFVVGMFSLLDAMTGLPMAQALEGLGLPDDVVEVLVHRRGPFQPFLDLVEACERSDDSAFAQQADALLLSGHQVNMAHLQALAWAEALLASA